ncbi:MAG: hypothetical protein IJS94_01990, partial [Clostridia bacterium]|nr:hypothetical protein [Clostridia bacterium]
MTRKRIIGVILALILVVQCAAVMSVTVSADTSVITAEDLVTAIESGSSFTLTKDIDMAGKTVTVRDVSGITVNGGGHVIKNLVTNKGMYSSATNCTFENLFLYNCKVVNRSATSNYGLIAGSMTGGSVTNCGVAGEMAVYGSNSSNVGGIAGSTNGTSITSSFAMVDIHTDASYVGGLVGKIGSGSTVGKVYSTGNIINSGYDHIGGLFGSSAVSVSNSYTTVFIENAYADTVKAIGCLENGASLSGVYYDSSISLQRQGDGDSANRLAGETAIDGFTPLTNGYYYIAGLHESLSYISAAKVDLDKVTPGSLTAGTGREYVPVSTESAYNTATLTVDDNIN